MKKFSDVFKDVATIKAYAARTIRQDPLQSFMFRVQLSGMSGEIGFQKVAGLSREVEVVEYFENMYEHAHKLPGRESVGEVTFEKGMFPDDLTFVNEYEKVLGTNKNECRHEVTIQVMNRFGEVKRAFTLYEAWFSKYEVADLDGNSSEVIIETLTVQFEYMTCDQ